MLEVKKKIENKFNKMNSEQKKNYSVELIVFLKAKAQPKPNMFSPSTRNN